MIEIVRATVDAGDGFAVMGNHEYNAIAYHTAVPGRGQAWFRKHSEKNTTQHQATLDQLSPNEMAEAIAWFKTFPVALELNGVLVHAAWRDDKIDLLTRSLESLGRFGVGFLAESEQQGSACNTAAEAALNGAGIVLPAGHSIVEKGGHERNTVRIKWYEEPVG